MDLLSALITCGVIIIVGEKCVSWHEMESVNCEEQVKTTDARFASASVGVGV